MKQCLISYIKKEKMQKVAKLVSELPVDILYVPSFPVLRSAKWH
jgi:hypothetical protein